MCVCVCVCVFLLIILMWIELTTCQNKAVKLLYGGTNSQHDLLLVKLEGKNTYEN
jgi:hypothetical protein